MACMAFRLFFWSSVQEPFHLYLAEFRYCKFRGAICQSVSERYMSGFFNDPVLTQDNLEIALHHCEKGFHSMTARLYFSLSSIVIKSRNLCLKRTHFIFLYDDVETCDLLTSLMIFSFLTMFFITHGMISTAWILYGNIVFLPHRIATNCDGIDGKLSFRWE